MADQDQLRREFVRVSKLLADAGPWSALAEIQRRFDTRLRELWKQHRKGIFPDHKLGDVYRELVAFEPSLADERAAAETEARAVREKYHSDKEFFEGWLEELAVQCEPRTSRTAWTPIRSFGTHSYLSTGSAPMYAQARAQRYAELLQELGLKTRIDMFDATAKLRDYIVLANVFESEKEILVYRPLSSLADDVAWYVKRGLNPRVYYPGLPHDFETKSAARRET